MVAKNREAAMKAAHTTETKHEQGYHPHLVLRQRVGTDVLEEPAASIFGVFVQNIGTYCDGFGVFYATTSQTTRYIRCDRCYATATQQF
jgi:hypothetical protein